MDFDGIYISRLEHIKKRQEELLISLFQDIEFLEKETEVKLNFSINDLQHVFKNKKINSVPNYIRLREQLSDKDFFNKVKPLLDEIPSSNGTNFFNKIDINIGIIADEFLYNSFKDIANFYYVNRNNYKELDIDVFIVASTWKGLENDWRGLGNPNNLKLREELYKIISHFRKKGVKIVFYSKEDPTNYKRFVDIAKECDYIFTTALEKVEDYKIDCNNQNVYVLEFGVNPIYNNPIGMKSEKLNGAIFAGSWYEKYPHRIKDTMMIFDGILKAESDLKIIDRNYDLDSADYFFPIQYLKYVSPSIDHNNLQKLFKLYLWVINLNSVQASETMFANRVYELQAMGNLIISNYSLGMNNIFPNIFIISDKRELNYILNNYSDKELYLHQLYGIRKVLRNSTTFHRINYLLNQIGIKGNFTDDKKVAVVYDVLNNNIQENFERQTYLKKELISTDEIKNIINQFDYITFFHPEYEYGEYYLEDLVNGFKYTNSSYITKDAYYKNGEKQNGIEHNFVNEIKDKYKTIFDVTRFEIFDLINLNEPKIVENGYSIDSMEIDVEPKHEEKELELKLSVIVPVYNNGDHLYSKCFMSLRRSSIFNNMDIILVDDGSTDQNTLKMLDRLERLYPNVQTYKFNDGGSGSASRPRNKGIELAKTDYITYLDPDNEAVNDSYAYMLREMQMDSNLDLIVGNIIKYDATKKELNYTDYAFNWSEDGVIENPREFLKQTNLRTQSIQALIIKKELITKNNLKMVDKAIGQDSLFFQQLIINSNKIKAVDRIVHIYFASVSNSVTNTISKKFFMRYLILEKERYKFLKNEKLLEIYIAQRFNYYFVNWYLKRVPRLNEDDLKDGLDTLYEIYSIYKNKLKDKSEPIIIFEKCIEKGEYNKFKEYCRKTLL